MPTTKTFLEEARLLQGKIVELRRHLHMHPELSFQEKETAALAAARLAELGYTVKTGVAETGVLADTGKGVTVAIRADMDALPVAEATGAPYQSRNPGIMHACGHDAHVSCALATADLLARAKLPGRVRFIMQPAEETGDDQGRSGAFKMIECGAVDGVDAIVGLHVDATLPAGKVGLRSGPTMAAADIFKVKIQGKGGHGAYPETTVDAIVIAAQVIAAVQQIVSRRISPLEPAVVTIGCIESESKRGNVISPAVTMEGTIRSFSEPVRKQLIDELNRACSIARVLGGDFAIEWKLGYPATINNPQITAIMREAAANLIGADNVLEIPPKTWSEDFSMLSAKVPGAFLFLGGEIAGDQRVHHSPTFDIDESALYIGSAILAETTRRLMEMLSGKRQA